MDYLFIHYEKLCTVYTLSLYNIYNIIYIFQILHSHWYPPKVRQDCRWVRLVDKNKWPRFSVPVKSLGTFLFRIKYQTSCEIDVEKANKRNFQPLLFNVFKKSQEQSSWLKTPGLPAFCLNKWFYLCNKDFLFLYMLVFMSCLFTVTICKQDIKNVTIMIKDQYNPTDQHILADLYLSMKLCVKYLDKINSANLNVQSVYSISSQICQ